jgi:tryptophan synthase alpha subunit
LRIRALTETSVAVRVGVSTPEHLSEIAAHGILFGSAIVIGEYSKLAGF